MIKFPYSTIKITREVKKFPEDWRNDETLIIEEIFTNCLLQDINEKDSIRFGDFIGKYSYKIYLPRDTKIDASFVGAICEIDGKKLKVLFVSQNKDFFLPTRYKFSQFIIVGDESV